MKRAAVSVCTALMLVVGCAEALDSTTSGSGEPDRQPADLPLVHVEKVSSALIAPTCSADQLQILTRAQEALLNALVDGINAYSANTNDPRAVEVFGERDQDQALTVFYNLLWGYQTLMADGQSVDIEYNCNAAYMCRDPEAIAWAEVPNFVAICKPDDPTFWNHAPYWLAHEIWHWLGWGDPQWIGSGDSAEEVYFYAKNDVATAIRMPHAYALYLWNFIEP